MCTTKVGEMTETVPSREERRSCVPRLPLPNREPSCRPAEDHNDYVGIIWLPRTHLVLQSGVDFRFNKKFYAGVVPVLRGQMKRRSALLHTIATKKRQNLLQPQKW